MFEILKPIKKSKKNNIKCLAWLSVGGGKRTVKLYLNEYLFERLGKPRYVQLAVDTETNVLLVRKVSDYDKGLDHIVTKVGTGGQFQCNNEYFANKKGRFYEIADKTKIGEVYIAMGVVKNERI